MRKPDGIEEWMARALTRSGLSMARRAEVAEEWRGHLEELTQERRERGMVGEAAVRDALEQFGRPEVLRRQLRRTQRAADHRAALAEVGRSAWVFTLAPAAIVALGTLLLDRATAGEALAAGVAFVAILSLPMATCTYLVIRGRTELLRARPQAEFAFAARFGFWALMGLATLATGLLIAGLLVLGLAPLFLWQELGPAASPFVAYFRLCLVSGVADSAVGHGGHLLAALTSVLLLALALAAVERTRCVDLNDSLVAENSGESAA